MKSYKFEYRDKFNNSLLERVYCFQNIKEARNHAKKLFGACNIEGCVNIKVTLNKQ